MLYAVMVVRDVDTPEIVELAGVFDAIEKASKALEMVKEWLEYEDDNYDIYILDSPHMNFLLWCDLEKFM